MRSARVTRSDSLLQIGVSHQTAPLELRERLSGLADLWDSIASNDLPELDEWVLLSTCNRLEIYVVTKLDSEFIVPRLLRSMEEAVGISDAGWTSHVYSHTGVDAAKHLCRVAAGLESFVLGEAQIQGQVADAFMSAVEDGSVSSLLTAVFRAAIRVGKRARTETSIGKSAASLSSIALRHAESMAGDLSSRTVLVVGLGKMGQLALKSLRARHVKRVNVANRTYERAVDVAKDLVWKPYGLGDLVEAIADSDIVITATGSHHPVITKKMVESALERRGSALDVLPPYAETANGNGVAGSGGRLGSVCGASAQAKDGQSLIVVDLGLPRDVEPQVGTLPSVSLVELDDLQADLDAALESRRQAVPRVEQIIDEELVTLLSSFREISMRPLVVDLRTKAETIRQNEVARTLRHLGDVDAETEAHLHHMTRALVNKLLHEPTVRIKQVSHEDDADDYAQTIRDLFGLPSGNHA